MGAGLVSQFTIQKEDADGGLYLISLAVGVLIVSIRGSSVDLMHVLFGTVLARSTRQGAVAHRHHRGRHAHPARYLLAGAGGRVHEPLFLRSVSRLGAPVRSFSRPGSA